MIDEMGRPYGGLGIAYGSRVHSFGCTKIEPSTRFSSS